MVNENKFITLLSIFILYNKLIYSISSVLGLTLAIHLTLARFTPGCRRVHHLCFTSEETSSESSVSKGTGIVVPQVKSPAGMPASEVGALV